MSEFTQFIDGCIEVALNPRPEEWPFSTRPWIEEADRLRRWIEYYKRVGWPGECLPWPSRKTSAGCGYLLGRRWQHKWYGKGWRCVATHHTLSYFIWEFTTGDLPDGQIPYQTICKNQLCWNFEHMALRPSSKVSYKSRRYTGFGPSRPVELYSYQTNKGADEEPEEEEQTYTGLIGMMRQHMRETAHNEEKTEA